MQNRLERTISALAECKVFTIFLTTPVSSVSCERSFSTLRRLKLWTRSSMTEERFSGLAKMLIHRGTNCMPTPKDIYEGESNWRHHQRHHAVLRNVKCTSAWTYGVFQIILENIIRACKHWKHVPFHTYSRSIFRRHISWQVLKITFRSLQIWKFSVGGYPTPPLQGLCIRHSW